LIPERWLRPTQALLLLDLIYFAFAIVFVSAIESLLCSRMADRLADNRGQPFKPNKELWGQGWVNTIVPLVNGFPHTGALARTATNIKLGAISPLAGIFKCVLKLLLAAFLASFLEKVPMACIGGILMYVALNMVKGEEVKQVLRHNWFHIGLMSYTALMVVVTDFLTGVLTALLIYAVYVLVCWYRGRPLDGMMTEKEAVPAGEVNGNHHPVGTDLIASGPAQH
jgi:MFS superfamily sulfate permease-like transporter